MFTSSANGWQSRGDDRARLTCPKVDSLATPLGIVYMCKRDASRLRQNHIQHRQRHETLEKQSNTVGLKTWILRDRDGTRTRDILRPAAARGELRRANATETRLTANIADSRPRLPQCLCHTDACIRHEAIKFDFKLQSSAVLHEPRPLDLGI